MATVTLKGKDAGLFIEAWQANRKDREQKRQRRAGKNTAPEHLEVIKTEVSPDYLCDGCGQWPKRGQKATRISAGEARQVVLCRPCLQWLKGKLRGF